MANTERAALPAGCHKTTSEQKSKIQKKKPLLERAPKRKRNRELRREEEEEDERGTSSRTQTPKPRLFGGTHEFLSILTVVPSLRGGPSLFADVSAKRRDIPERKSSSSSSRSRSIIASTDASSMSRRKQAKPQHLKSDEDPALTGVISEHARGDAQDDADSGNESRSGSEETHVCEKCCAEFFKWSDFCEHLKSCTKNPLVLIVNDNEDTPNPSQEYPTEPSPVPSCPSEQDDSEDPGRATTVLLGRVMTYQRQRP
ncbi:hypothetical protein Q5P01_010865 [Channa striata]|uniref:C2H2-type domain-containing protein n=1 Tax=Channa striata TaxID=64152 RepID=A0AA88MS44_CHASR|nr:hypothetical protein Q5P01_010865 [Channa striata]